MPGDGATQRLARVAGKSLTMLMVLTGAPIGAATALQAGLIAEVTPDGQALACALDLAAVIASKAPVAARLAKQAVLAAYETTLSAGLARSAGRSAGIRNRGPDRGHGRLHREAAGAFRRPLMRL
ncbi:MAG: enoyl-CoA hydratase-related protein [Acetobacteraceae bacterium]